MNSLWPAASRISCLQPRRSILQICHRVDSHAARLAQKSIRPYSIPSLPFRRRLTEDLGTRPLGRTCQPQSPFRVIIRNFASRRIVTLYDQVPKYYEDGNGLQFRERPLSQDEVTAIFGKGIDTNTANRLLTVLHGRRVAGTLEDPKFFYTTNKFEERAKKVALAWLRKNVPVDEVESSARKAEEELREMEAELLADSERIGLYKPNSEVQKTNGESALDAVRKSKESELDEKEAEEAKEKRMSQAGEIRYNTGTLEKITARSKVELRRRGENPKLKYYLERAKVLPDTPPEMTKFQRLWPSGLVVLGVVLGSLVFTQVYTPPKQSARMWPDMPPAAATVIAIFIANSIIFGAWHVPMMLRTLNKYFITVPGYPFPMSLVGNIFSHQTLSHFTINMVVLWFVGTRLHDEVGRANFLAIYLSCGAVGSFASLSSWVIRNNFVSSSLGASGALAGIIAAYLWLNKSETVKLFGIFPPEGYPGIPAAVFLALLIGSDAFCLTRWNRTPITLDHWAHLGGYVAGIGAAELLTMRARQMKQIEMERRKNLGVLDRIKEGRL
jgi:rhomboid-like protein